MKADFIKETDIGIGKLLDAKAAAEKLDLNAVHSLGRSVLMESYLLLNTGSRKASLFYVQTQEEYEEATSLVVKLGLGFKTRPFVTLNPSDVPTLLTIRGFTFTDKEESRRIDNLNMSYSSSAIDFYDKVSPVAQNRMGELLEYPGCCIRAYVEDMYHFIDPDARLLEQTVRYRSMNRPVNADAFYLEEFLPCKPDCGNASAKGRGYERYLDSKTSGGIASIYRELKNRHLKDVEDSVIIDRKERGWKKISRYG